MQGILFYNTIREAVRNENNLSPNRYVAQNDKAEVLPLEEAVVLLRQAEEERATADWALKEMLGKPGLEF